MDKGYKRFLFIISDENMKSVELYTQLEKDFIRSGMMDNWIDQMKNKRFLSDNFKHRSMGVVCDNSNEIKRVYTAVFPTDAILRRVAKTRDSLLFLHHPESWDISKDPVFQEMNQELLGRLKSHRVSIYNLHLALDNFSQYSTSTTLAKKLGITDLKPFALFNGSNVGVFGKTRLRTINALSRVFERVVKHRISLYAYGNSKIRKGLIAVVAGGGNNKGVIQKVAGLGINTFVSGITVLNAYSKKTHIFAKRHRINILGGTHYSTEKFACIEMCKYFRKLGLPSKFIAGKPGFDDL